MADCFISYRRTPSAPVASSLQSKLESKHGLDVYVDTTRADSTHVRFPERLMQAIEDAPVFVCLLGERDGQHTLESGWVMKEIQQAYELQKFCIPVFQESYRPLPDMPACVDYLLGFDGVHILDQKNIMIDESVRQIAGLIQPQRKKRLITPSRIGAIVGLVLVAVAAAIGIALSRANAPDLTPEPPINTITGLMVTDTPTLTQTQTPVIIPTATPLPTELPIALVVGTLDKQATREQGTANAVATVAARGTDYAMGTQQSLDGTATATLATNTPTPDVTASIEAYRTEQASTLTQEWINSWTPTPTSTNTPTITPTLTITPMPILSPEQIALTPQTANADWTPFERDFDSVTMVLVPAGCFMMGSNDGEDREQPVHQHCFDKSFWIDKYEVTNAQYGSFGRWSGDGLPRETVTWSEAQDFCEAHGGRLSTEAEWEYAARGPSGLVYPWGNDFIPHNAVYSGNSNNQAAPVGSRPGGVSWVGALDMSGNVWEWTLSEYRPYPYDLADGRENTSSNARRVVRGGSWGGSDGLLRAAYRLFNDPTYSLSVLGFRCMRPVD